MNRRKIQYLDNDNWSVIARDAEPSKKSQKNPIAIKIRNNGYIKIREFLNKVPKLSITFDFKRKKSKTYDIAVKYSIYKNIPRISIGFLNDVDSFDFLINRLDDDSLHKLVCSIAYNLFDLSNFVNDQLFYVNLGRCITFDDGYGIITFNWYCGEKSLVKKYGEDNNQELFYDGKNHLKLSYNLKELSFNVK